MPNFTIAPATPLRFDGDFRIEPDQNHPPTTEEGVVLDAVKAALNVLAGDEALDVAAGYPTALLTARRDARKTVASDLKADTQKLASGQLTLAAATERADALSRKYRAGVPKFGTKAETSPRFAADFHIVVASNSAPTAEETDYLGTLKTTLDELATDEATDPAANYSQFVLAARKAFREDTASRLRSDADKFCMGNTNAKSAAGEVLVVKGMYRARRDRLTRRLFNVGTMKSDENKKEEDLVVDVAIEMASDLPAPEDSPSPEKQDLFVQINKAGTVIRTVCQRMKDRAEGRWSSKAKVGARARAKLLLDEYVDKLYGVAYIGLEDRHTALAKLALAELRNEFVAREAGRIKNRYVRYLGAWAGLAALLFLTAYVVVMLQSPGWAWWQTHKTFLLAAVGAAIGTWVSFSVRQVQLSFDDLLMLEEDALDPPLRVIFVVAMTLTACLLFWTGAINLEIGNLKTKHDAFGSTGSVALLVGVFAGLSERALATAISGRAAAFVKGIGSGG